MAITVISPNTLCFAGNPILVTASTYKSLASDESFLRIVCNASFSASGHTLDMEYSQPIANGGEAVFNIADAAQSVINRIQAEIDMNATSGNYWYDPITVVCSFSCKVVWIKDNVEQSPSGYQSPTFSINAIPGRFTDYEMLTLSSIELTSIVDKKPMTRKPDLGMVYKGETVIVPMASTSSRSDTSRVYIGDKHVLTSYASLSAYSLDYSYINVNIDAVGDISVDTEKMGTLSGHYRTNTNGVHFLRFINGFGAVENISVRSKDKLSYEVSGETHSLVQGVTTRPTDRRYAVKSQPVGVYELSSGYVPQKWAEWYVQELLTSPRVWIQLGGKWVPALIEAEDDCVIYDRSKPEMPHVDFTLRLAIDGVTGVAW